MKYSYRMNNRRSLKRLAERMRLMRTSRGLALFGIGLMLGATVFLLRQTLIELRGSASGLGASLVVQTEPLKPITPIEERDKVIGSGAAGQAASPEPLEPRQAGGAAATGEDPPEYALGDVVVRVYLTEEKKVEAVPIEAYVQGVVAAEMPINFELEALKAQAIAARTYIVRRLELGDRSGMPSSGADVTDTIQHQAYLSLKELESKWTGKAKTDNLAKLKRAVEDTRGLVITYEGEPIQAAFFSTSNGFTENSEDYWQQELPYLRSVSSPWDEELSPRYEETVRLSLKDFYKKLDLTGKSAKGMPDMKVIEVTDGKRIGLMKINGQSFTGRELRERLSLASSQFTWKVSGSKIAITTYGYGHGVGMSQWGANGMAMEGAAAEEILRHYYSGTSITQASKLP